MAQSYVLKVITHFASAHRLRDYPGACQRLHGHNWKIEAEVEASKLNAVGMGIDFKTIRQYSREIGDLLDHQYLNEIPPFDTINPTAENIAAWFYKKLAECINQSHVRVKAITLWETEYACVRYSETS